MPELRKDPVTRGWVIFAPERSKRPADFFGHGAPAAGGQCPFCPGHEEADDPKPILLQPPTAGYEGQPWSMKVIPDKYPLLSADEPFERFGEGIYDLMNGRGVHELIIESPVHSERFDDFSHAHLCDLLALYQNRILELSRDPHVQHILITRNIGHDAGAFIGHPHSHVVALPIVPKKLLEELSGAEFYFQFKDRCIFCDIIAQEVVERDRVVSENESFIALCPYASRFPFEVWVLPKTHLSRYETIRPDELSHLASIMRPLVGGLNALLKDPPLNYIVHSAPTMNARRDRFEDVGRCFHWHLELLPKLTKVAGFEWGSGFYINPILPEDAARLLREAVASAGASAGSEA